LTIVCRSRQIPLLFRNTYHLVVLLLSMPLYCLSLRMRFRGPARFFLQCLQTLPGLAASARTGTNVAFMEEGWETQVLPSPPPAMMPIRSSGTWMSRRLQYPTSARLERNNKRRGGVNGRTVTYWATPASEA
jgi:hypothetical protein